MSPGHENVRDFFYLEGLYAVFQPFTKNLSLQI